LRKKGLVTAIGLGVNEWPVLMDAMEIGPWDVVLLANRYNLIEQTTLRHAVHHLPRAWHLDDRGRPVRRRRPRWNQCLGSGTTAPTRPHRPKLPPKVTR
jgi:hypothetical protein